MIRYFLIFRILMKRKIIIDFQGTLNYNIVVLSVKCKTWSHSAFIIIGSDELMDI